MTEITPMSLVRAFEAIKVIEPYAKDLVDAPKETHKFLSVMVAKMLERRATDLLHLIALVQGRDISEVAEEYKDAEPLRVHMVLVDAFTANPLPDLINAGYALGMIEVGWNDGS